MIEIFSEIYKIVGLSNILTILIFFISTLIAYYLYFRTFYRLVFSQSPICRNYDSIEEWNKDDTEFESRIIFYNNGRKTLNNKNIENLEILAENEIISFEQIVTNQKVNFKSNRKKVKINLENLDSKEYMLLKVMHKGKLNISGRISESGKILNTETKTWLKLNFIFLIVVPIIIFTPFILLFVTKNIVYFFPNLIISILLIHLMLFCVRYIHKMFFIPDELTEVFLKTKNHNNSEFKTEIK